MKRRVMKKILSLLMIFTLVFQQTGFAQGLGQLDIGRYINQPNAFSGLENFRPLQIRYFSYEPLTDNFQLLLDKGDLKKIPNTQLKEQAQELLKYFLIGVTLSDDNFWVNLRPDSEEQVINPELARTDLGKVLLEADLELKKDVARFTSPQTKEGREYWNKLYEKANQIFSSADITIPTLTRPWIVPGEVIIRETANSAYVYKATLKVMLEQDHLKDSSDYKFSDPRLKELNAYSAQIIRQNIIPKLTKEVNSSAKYAPLRQVFSSLILARWFKHKFAGKQGLYPNLINTGNLTGLTSPQAWSKTTYFKEYQKSFAQGEYNVKEQVNSVLGSVIRTYFSGGIAFGSEFNSLLGRFMGINPWVTRALWGNGAVALEGTPDAVAMVPALERTVRVAASPVENKPEVVRAASSPVERTRDLKRYGEIGQQIYLDGVTWEQIESGEFERLVTEQGISGVTTNPPLIKKYLTSKEVQKKAGQLSKRFADEGLSYEEVQARVYHALIADLAAMTIDILLKYNQDPTFSIEIDPTKADDVEASVREAMQWLNIKEGKYRDYIMVKVVANEKGYEIIRRITAQGGNVNATLILTPQQLYQVAMAIIEGLEEADADGIDISKIRSAMSFFPSRWDVKLAPDLSEKQQGKVANAVTTVAYHEVFLKRFNSERFLVLQTKGAKRPMFIEGSTGSKAKSIAQVLKQNPEYKGKEKEVDALVASAYPFDIYVTALQGDGVVNTLPYDTITALIEQGFVPEATINQEARYLAAKQILTDLRDKNGKDIDVVGEVLLQEGLQAFIDDYLDVQRTLAGIVSASSPLQAVPLDREKTDARQGPGAASSPLAPGGIDFRAIPMITQPMGNLSGLNFSLPKLSNVANINLDEELRQIQKMLSAGIIPSGERLKEYVAACYQKGELKVHLEGIVASIVDICKLEEEKVVETTNELKEVMLILDSTG